MPFSVLKPGRGEHQGLGAHGDEDGVKLAVEHLRGSLAVQLDLNVPLAHLVDQIVLVGAQGVLELHVLGETRAPPRWSCISNRVTWWPRS